MRRLILSLLLLAGCAAQTSPPAPERPPVADRAAEPASSPAAASPITRPMPTAAPTVAPTVALPPAPTATPSDPTVTIAAVGDVMLARDIGRRIEAEGAAAPLAAVAPILRQADLALANLECALGTGGEPAPKAYRFLGPPAGASGLAVAGIDAVSLSNNHSLDWGWPTLSGTMRLLDDAGVAHVGAGPDAAAARRPLLLDAGGMRLALLAYTHVPVERGGFDTAAWIAGPAAPGLAWAEPAQIAADVAAARERADHVIVLLHSGYEGLETPNEFQRAAAYAAIDSGAALVLGAHPHVLQGLERRGDGLIAYSLGNFVFDGFDGAANDTAILTVTLGLEGVRGHGWVPARIEDGFPRPLDPAGEGAPILRRLDELSAALK